MIDEMFAHYRITQKLGEGGMGEIWLAEDTTLKRKVALKFIRPGIEGSKGSEGHARFIREAQAAAALDHPNICTVYEVGEHEGRTYIAMAYIEGRSVSEIVEEGPLPVDDALAIAMQAGSGLREAHARGIVHRDVKSANIMVTPEGRVKVMDFGLALTTDTSRLTMAGTAVGTAAYMSPEQAVGRDVDERADIWAMGVVLYEMIAGELPFKGSYDQAIIYSIVNEKPVPLTDLRPGVPLELERFVMRALKKEPENRYSSLEEMLSSLDKLRESLRLLPRRNRLQLIFIRNQRKLLAGAVIIAAAAAIVMIGSRLAWRKEAVRASIAVLPGRFESSDSSLSYLGDASTGDIISRLAGIGTLNVRSRLSVEKYRSTDLNPTEIADELGATHLLYPSIRYEGNRLLISLDLIDPETENVVWSNTYSSRTEGLLSVWNQVALEVAHAVGVSIDEPQRTRLSTSMAINPEAYQLFQEGMILWERREEKLLAIELMEKSVVLDSTYAPAWAGLAAAYAMLAHPSYRYGSKPSYTEVLRGTDVLAEDAREAADRALRLDSDFADALAVKGALLRRSDPVRSEEYLQRAIKLKPGYLWSHHWYSQLLAQLGRHDESTVEAAAAVEIDPTINVTRTVLGRRLTDARRYEEAEKEFLASLEIKEWGQTYFDMTILYTVMGQYGKAEDAMKSGMKAWDMDTTYVHPLFLAMRGEIPAEKIFPFIEVIERRYGPVKSAEMYAQLGEIDRAVEALDRAYTSGAIFETSAILTSPVFDPIAQDPRFIEIKKKAIEDR